MKTVSIRKIPSLACFIGVLSLSFLTACASVQVEESSFIRPDSLRGALPLTRIDQDSLKRTLADGFNPDALSAIQLTDLSIDGGLGTDHPTLNGVLLRRTDAVATVLYFGGNAFRIDESGLRLAARLSGCPVNIAMFDYRGYGRTAGTPTISNLQIDGIRIFDRTNAQMAGNVFVHGQSLGSFMAAHVAQQRSVQGVILEATATHAQEWADSRIPALARPFVTVNISPSLLAIDNTRALANLQRPSLVIAGGQDTITPPELGQKVHQAIPNPEKELLMLPEGGHNNLLNTPQAAQAYCAFILKHRRL